VHTIAAAEATRSAIVFWCCLRLATALIGHDRSRHYQPLSSGLPIPLSELWVVRSDEMTRANTGEPPVG
jgi:hypothetical protein